ncbi:hypothetical protein PINS_up000646 [Pythium insidiosum]|nr:hypothetical protein PINS_up000646 [Pythium insidiosum]
MFGVLYDSCPFVDNCVGRRNYVFFLGFVGALTFDILLLLVVFYQQWKAVGGTWWMLVTGTYMVVALLPVGHLFGFHCYLTARNLTTNEVMNAHRYEYMRSADGQYRNPFDRGMLRNVIGRLAPSLFSEDSNYQRVPQDEATPRVAMVAWGNEDADDSDSKRRKPSSGDRNSAALAAMPV